MARSGKFLYYCVDGGTKYCVPLYNNTDCFSYVPGYKTLSVNSNGTIYYAVMGTSYAYTNTTKLRYNNYYVYNGIKYNTYSCTWVNYQVCNNPYVMSVWKINPPYRYYDDVFHGVSGATNRLNSYCVCYLYKGSNTWTTETITDGTTAIIYTKDYSVQPKVYLDAEMHYWSDYLRCPWGEVNTWLNCSQVLRKHSNNSYY